MTTFAHLEKRFLWNEKFSKIKFTSFLHDFFWLLANGDNAIDETQRAMYRKVARKEMTSTLREIG